MQAARCSCDGPSTPSSRSASFENSEGDFNSEADEPRFEASPRGLHRTSGNRKHCIHAWAKGSLNQCYPPCHLSGLIIVISHRASQYLLHSVMKFIESQSPTYHFRCRKWHGMMPRHERNPVSLGDDAFFAIARDVGSTPEAFNRLLRWASSSGNKAGLVKFN